MPRSRDPLPALPGWLSVKETAALAGRSVSSIRRAIVQGDLPVKRLQGRILIAAAHGRQFAQLTRPQGQPRLQIRHEEQPPAEEEQARILVTLTVQLRAGQPEAFEQWLRASAEELPQRFPGTLDRSIKQSQARPDMILIMLVWDAFTIPPAPECETMLAALRADLASIVSWETEERYEQRILLHTL